MIGFNEEEMHFEIQFTRNVLECLGVMVFLARLMIEDLNIHRKQRNC